MERAFIHQHRSQIDTEKSTVQHGTRQEGDQKDDEKRVDKIIVGWTRLQSSSAVMTREMKFMF